MINQQARLASHGQRWLEPYRVPFVPKFLKVRASLCSLK